MLHKVQNKDEILQRVKTAEVRKYLKDLWIKRLRLFGSFARWEQSTSSDVDFLYEEDPKVKIWRDFFLINDFLKDKLWRNVDMVSKNFINHRIKKYILSDKISIL